jgi:hypothetical protein
VVYFALDSTLLDWIALRCVALRCVALRCVAWRCVAWRCVAWRGVALRCITSDRILLCNLILNDIVHTGVRASNQPSLMNVMMELRKCCNHPYLLRYNSPLYASILVNILGL